MIRKGLPLALALLATAAAAATGAAYRAGPPPGHTGAFGEPDCGSCHFDAVRDDDRGDVVIHAPGSYEPGRRYAVTVELRHADLQAGGFQLTARFLAGDGAGVGAGEQAGSLEPADDRSRIQLGENGVVYASHSAAGVNRAGPGAAAPAVVKADPSGAGPDALIWKIRWTAPMGGGPVAFDVAAQAANDDDSVFGERFFQARHVVEPADGRPRGR